MQFGKALKNIVFPMMAENGFAVLEIAPGFCDFSNEDNTLRVIIDRHPWPPACLRVNCHFRDRYHLFSHFELEQLDPSLDGILFYSNQSELEDKLRLITEKLQNKAIPFLRHLHANHVLCDKRMFTLLSNNPVKQASDFANRHTIQITYERSNFLFLENLLNELRGDVDSERRVTFEKHFLEIVNIMAYYGEIVRKKDNSRSKWAWASDGMYGIECIKRDGGWFFPHNNIMCFWDYSPYISAYRLLP